MFKLSENIDPNKVFIVNRSELERRIDPHFHKKEYNIIKEKLSLIPTSSIRNESVKIFSGITPLSGGDAYTDKDNGIPFVRSGDFSEDNPKLMREIVSDHIPVFIVVETSKDDD